MAVNLFGRVFLILIVSSFLAMMTWKNDFGGMFLSFGLLARLIVFEILDHAENLD